MSFLFVFIQGYYTQNITIKWESEPEKIGRERVAPGEESALPGNLLSGVLLGREGVHDRRPATRRIVKGKITSKFQPNAQNWAIKLV